MPPAQKFDAGYFGLRSYILINRKATTSLPNATP
jgi:hypothetical protein